MATELMGYIEKLGDEKAAKLFSEKPRTVASWRRGERLPSQKKAKKIIKRTRGELSFDSIYGLTKTSTSPEASPSN